MAFRLALHTWTLDTTPLGEALAVIKKTGWDAVELRRVDWERAAEVGQSPEQVLALVRASGLAVACVGVELGWVWAADEERARLLRVFGEQCARAKALGCPTVMSAVNRGRGDVGEAAGACVRSATSRASTGCAWRWSSTLRPSSSTRLRRCGRS
jgi:2-keto-myo-inositol isomerase